MNELIFKYKIKLNALKTNKKNNEDKLKKISEEYEIEKNKIIDTYYSSIVQSIIDKNYNPINQLKNKESEIVKYYESEYSQYLTKMKNKINFIEKLETKFANKNNFIKKIINKRKLCIFKKIKNSNNQTKE